MFAHFLLTLIFITVIYQDFKERAISAWTVPLIFAISIYLAWTNNLWQVWFLYFNIIFIGIQLLGVSLYFSVKHRRWVNITQHYLGIGDIGFFVAISPLFAPVHFCLFFIGALILILLGAAVYHLSIKKLKTIPLAGAMSICWFLYVLLLSYYNLSSYNDWHLLQHIYG